MLILYLKEKKKQSPDHKQGIIDDRRRLMVCSDQAAEKTLIEKGRDGAEVKKIKSIKFLKSVESFVLFDLSLQFYTTLY